jgi:hypothetical protein
MCMDPSSPLAKRTYHLLQPPDISLANDSILLIGYLYGISSERKLVEELRMHLATVRCLTGRLRSSPAGYKRDSAAPVRLLFRCPDLPVHSCARCPFIGKIQNARRSGDVFDSTLTVVHLLEHSLEPLYSRVADLNRCTH